jgi:hypothetical protein
VRPRHCGNRSSSFTVGATFTTIGVLTDVQFLKRAIENGEVAKR